jgi:hypothetical protein
MRRIGLAVVLALSLVLAPLVYVNFWLFNKPQMSLEQFAELAKPWATKFPEIWLLWVQMQSGVRPSLT